MGCHSGARRSLDQDPQFIQLLLFMFKLRFTCKVGYSLLIHLLICLQPHSVCELISTNLFSFIFRCLLFCRIGNAAIIPGLHINSPSVLFYIFQILNIIVGLILVIWNIWKFFSLVYPKAPDLLLYDFQENFYERKYF